MAENFKEKSQSSQNGNGSGNNSNGIQNVNGSSSLNNGHRSSEYEDLDLKKLKAFIVNYIPPPSLQIDPDTNIPAQGDTSIIPPNCNLIQYLNQRVSREQNLPQMRYNGPTSSGTGSGGSGDDQNKNQIKNGQTQNPY